MTTSLHKLFGALLAIVGTAVLAPAAHAAMTWGFQQPGTCAQNATNKDNFGNSWACGGGNPALTVSGYSSNGSGSTFAAAFVDDNNSLGFGVKSTSEGRNATQPQHAMDNNGSTDAMLLSFTSSVILRQVGMGYAQTDSDITLLRYTGTTDPVAAGKLAGLGIGALISNGWELVGNYGNVGTTLTDVNSAGASSSWWLLAAYNSTLAGSAASANNKAVDAGNDYVKVLTVVADAVTTSTGNVPEPGSFALAGLALAGIAATRRRKTAAGEPAEA